MSDPKTDEDGLLAGEFNGIPSRREQPNQQLWTYNRMIRTQPEYAYIPTRPLHDPPPPCPVVHRLRRAPPTIPKDGGDAIGAATMGLSHISLSCQQHSHAAGTSLTACWLTLLPAHKTSTRTYRHTTLPTHPHTHTRSRTPPYPPSRREAQATMPGLGPLHPI
jgi:hypothetical protein